MMCSNWHEFEKPSNNLITNETAIDFDMFGTFMEDRIGGNINSSLVVTKQESWRSNAKVLE